MESVEQAAEAAEPVVEVASAWDSDKVQSLLDLVTAVAVTDVFLLAALLFVAGVLLASVFSRRLNA